MLRRQMLRENINKENVAEQFTAGCIVTHKLKLKKLQK